MVLANELIYELIVDGSHEFAFKHFVDDVLIYLVRFGDLRGNKHVAVGPFFLVVAQSAGVLRLLFSLRFQFLLFLKNLVAFSGLLLNKFFHFAPSSEASNLVHGIHGAVVVHRSLVLARLGTEQFRHSLTNLHRCFSIET